MPVEPTWVKACLLLDGLSWGDGSDEAAPGVVSASGLDRPLTSPLETSKGRFDAQLGYEVPEHYAHRLLPCPPNLRVKAYLHACEMARRVCSAACLSARWARWWAHPRVKYWRGYPWTNWRNEVTLWEGPSFYCNKCRPVGVWIRCRVCEREKARWRRAVVLAEDMTWVSRHLKKSIRFVTLTLPNVEDVQQGMVDIKRKVKNLRRSTAFGGKVVGGSDFYEYTVAEDGSFNVHHHGLWIGNYWKQADLTAAWNIRGGGHTWISAIRRGKRGTKRMVGYGVKYATKQAELGIRSRARFGCLYGAAFAELESARRDAETAT